MTKIVQILATSDNSMWKERLLGLGDDGRVYVSNIECYDKDWQELIGPIDKYQEDSEKKAEQYEEVIKQIHGCMASWYAMGEQGANKPLLRHIKRIVDSVFTQPPGDE